MKLDEFAYNFFNLVSKAATIKGDNAGEKKEEYFDIPLDENHDEVSSAEEQPLNLNDDNASKCESPPIHIKEEPKFSPLSNDIMAQLTAIASHSKRKTATSSLRRGQTKCDECDKTYSCKYNLDLHVKTVHLKILSNKCDFCEYKTNYPDAMAKHRRTHTGEKPFACENCEYRCGDASSLINHNRVKHGIGKPKSDKKYYCDLCDKSFTRGHQVKRHKDAVHEGIKRCAKTPGTACETCGKLVHGNPGSMQQHMLIHQNGRNPTQAHMCSSCGETFATLKLLSQHKNKVHSKAGKDEEPKTKYCEICKKEFSSVQSFKHHNIVAHTKEYPEMCEGCGKGFTGTGLGQTIEKHKENCLLWQE